MFCFLTTPQSFCLNFGAPDQYAFIFDLNYLTVVSMRRSIEYKLVHFTPTTICIRAENDENTVNDNYIIRATKNPLASVILYLFGRLGTRNTSATKCLNSISASISYHANSLPLFLFLPIYVDASAIRVIILFFVLFMIRDKIISRRNATDDNKNKNTKIAFKCMQIEID